MPRRHAIVIAVDGLRASALGAYGNTTYATPALDALAAQSLLVDWMWCNGPGMEDFYRAAWFGEPPKIAPAGVDQRRQRPLLELLEQAGVASSLTTDDPTIAGSAEQLSLTEVRRIDVAGDLPAGSIADTALAQLFAIAIDQVAAWAEGEAAGAAVRPQLLWLHARGFHAAWDAPRELRQQLLEEDELVAADFVVPPGAARVQDPDELLQFRAAYAAQAMVLDACVEALMSALGECGLDRQPLVVLVGCRGFALGEHGLVGGAVRSLYSEVLQVPCLIRQPNAEAPPPRTARLAQPHDLYALVRDWFDADAGELSAERSWLLTPHAAAAPPPLFVYAEGADGEQALRTPAWLLRRPPGAPAATAAIELYAKPFDRWDANEVAARRPDVAERLLAILDAGPVGQPLASLDADLIEPTG